VHEIILQTVNGNGHNLLVLGSNDRSGFNRFMMGIVTEQVIREMPCSFATTITHDIFQLCPIAEAYRTFKHFLFLPTPKAITKEKKSFDFCLRSK